VRRHILKTDPSVFQASWDEEKPYEIRIDDRDFQVGDELLLTETVYTSMEMKNGKPLEYTGRAILQTVIHKLRGGQYGIQDGWCILGTSYIMCVDNYSLEDDLNWQLW
jgi:hypothetical protein